MSTTVWPFAVLRPFGYLAMHRTTRTELNNGLTTVRAEFGTYGKYGCRFRTRLPYGSATNETWQAQLRTWQGAYDSFLFKDPKTALFYLVGYSDTDGAIGTGDGTTTVFYLAHKYIDSTTLGVKKAGTLQTISTHYTFGGNNSAPAVTFLSAPTAGQAITVTYEFYMPVRFVGDPTQGDYLGGDSNFGGIDVEIEETLPGAHRV